LGARERNGHQQSWVPNLFVQGGAMKGAAQRWVVASVVSLVVIGTNVAWGAEATGFGAPVTDKDRAFKNYTRETATVNEHQFRIELDGLIAQKDGPDARLNAAGFLLPPQQQVNNQLNAGYLNLLASYGFMKGGEAGFIIPGVWQELQQTGKTTNTGGVGDFLMYGKYQRALIDDLGGGALNGGGGVELTMPNGSADKGLGTGAFGANPFLSARYTRGPLALGGHVGYDIYTAGVPDVFNYSIEGIVRPSPVWAFRTEWTGRIWNQGGNRQWDAVFLPGIDFNLTDSFIIRPTGLANGSARAYSWGVGVGVAALLDLPKPAVAQAPPPPPPPAPPPVKKKIVLRGVHFDFNKWNIRPPDRAVLDEAIATLKQEGSISVICQGYTDSIGSDAYNLKLSMRRAEAVRDYLVAGGIAADRIKVEGFGKADPVASNDTADGRAQNRRVELRVVGD
jgi:outer membrane protein OmpA-like peptidoglycan-associated protein